MARDVAARLRRAGCVVSRTIGIALVSLALVGCALPTAAPEPTKTPDKLVLEATFFDRVAGWPDDRLSEAIPALIRSCGRIKEKAHDLRFDGAEIAGRIGDWMPICAEAAKVPPGDEPRARYFFESQFTPYQVLNNGVREGLLTGYYEAELHGSWTRNARFQVPIYGRPQELMSVDLGAFRPEWKGQELAGRLDGHTLKPFPNRKEIESGALSGRQLEILWVDDAIDAFFLHVQGSGRVRMSDGGTVRLGFAGRNGHRYVPIGRELVAAGAMPLEKVTMQSIRAWLRENPARGQELMWRNPSYIFFRTLEGDGPVGAQGAVLTPERSVAVDRAHVPLGVPLWIASRDPLAPNRPLHRLAVSQDVGSAIVGPVRADLFFGFGEQAALAAGAMRQPMRMFVLLPKNRTR